MITGEISRMVDAFERLMCFNPQYHVRTYRSKSVAEIVVYRICADVRLKSRFSFPVMMIIENNKSDPKNILLNVTTQLLSLFSIAFLEIVFSSAQRTVADKTSRSPILMSGVSFARFISTSPKIIISIAISCFFVTLSFKNIIASIVA